MANVLDLMLNRRKTGISLHRVAGFYGSMWRIRLPDGRWSPMANLSRAKDGARLHAGREFRPRGMKEWDVITWKPGESASEAPPEAVLSWLDPFPHPE